MCNIDEWMKKNKLQNQATPLAILLWSIHISNPQKKKKKKKQKKNKKKDSGVH